MTSQLGSFLRQLRQSRRLSQAQAAQAAGIGRVTLNRWEMAVQQPRVVELEALLRTLTATAQERQKALGLLSTPQARAHIRDTLVRAGEQKGIGPMPHGGDLLRALRLRRGLSQEETAQRIGVTVRTLRHWEKYEVWPSPTQLHTLCYVLEAATEEMVALTTGDLSPASATPRPNAAQVSLQELRVQAHHLNFYIKGWPAEALKELSYVTLETQAWPLATRSEEGGQTLATLYSHHARYLAAHERFTESGVYATRALDLWPLELRPNPTIVQASIDLARSVVYRGTRPAPRRGLEVLGYWLREARWPEYEAWILSDMATYLTQVGNAEQGLQLVQQARVIAARSENPHELYNRELDQARLLLAAGQPRQALMMIERHRDTPLGAMSVKFALQEVETYLRLEEPALAHDRLQEAWRLIKAGAPMHLERQAQALTLRF